MQLPSISQLWVPVAAADNLHLSRLGAARHADGASQAAINATQQNETGRLAESLQKSKRQINHPSRRVRDRLQIGKKKFSIVMIEPTQIVTINHFVAGNPGALICSFIISKHVQR